VPKPEDDWSILEEERLAGIEEMAHAMDAGLRKSVERVGNTLLQAAAEVRKKWAMLLKAAMILLLMGLVSTLGGRASALMVYNCTNQVNIVRSYSLLGPHSKKFQHAVLHICTLYGRHVQI
jgi:hypothetical protein